MPFRCCIAAGLSRPWRAGRRARRRCSCKARWCSRSQNWCRWSARLSVLRQSVPRCRFHRQGTAEPVRSVLRCRIFWSGLRFPLPAFSARVLRLKVSRLLRRTCDSARIMECRCSRETLNKTKSTRSNERLTGLILLRFALFSVSLASDLMISLQADFVNLIECYAENFILSTLFFHNMAQNSVTEMLLFVTEL